MRFKNPKRSKILERLANVNLRSPVINLTKFSRLTKSISKILEGSAKVDANVKWTDGPYCQILPVKNLQQPESAQILLAAASRGSEDMSSELQGRSKALQELLAAAMAEQEVEATRVRGEEAARAEEAGRGTSSQEEAMRAREAELKESAEGGGGRPAIDGAF